MAFNKATAAEIDKKLREDFRRRLKDYGVSAEATDPILAVLFRTFAGQLEAQYSEIERIRVALLDELISGLGIEGRRARPAQTVVGFGVSSGAELIEAGTELIGDAQSGEKLTFTTDLTVAASPAVISLGATYQEGSLELAPGLELPEKLQATRPSLEPVRVNLGPNPAVFLAIENLPPTHLSQHGFFFELSPDAHTIQKALLSETWCLAGSEGEFGCRGILRPRRANAGVQALSWLLPEPSTDEKPAAGDVQVATLRDGFYAGRVFVFPVVPQSRRFLCRVPRGLDSALGKIFGRSASQVLDAPRAWLRISMPRGISSLHTGLASVSLHAVTASNVECLNETIYFDKHGTSIPVSREAATQQHLVSPLSIVGESSSPYLPEFEPSSDLGAGRYAIRAGRIDLEPARRPDGRRDAYANLRLWVTRGSLGNLVGPGRVQTISKKGALQSVRVTNPTSAAGGSDGENFQDTQARFAEALLSRDRIVTRADLVGIVRAFDRRILNAHLASALERNGQGLERVQRVRVLLDRDEFLDPEQESRVLQDELLAHLRERFLYDTELNVALEWK